MRAAVRDLPGGIPPAGHVLRTGKPEEADRQGGPRRLRPLLLPGLHAGVLFNIPVELRAAQSVRAEGPPPLHVRAEAPFPPASLWVCCIPMERTEGCAFGPG